MKLQIMAATIAAIFLQGCGSSNQAPEPPEKASYIVGHDITGELQADLDANCQVTLPRGWYYTTAPIVVRGNNCGVTGSGDWNNGTVIQPAHAGDAFVLEACQHCYIGNINVQGGGGYAAKVDRTFAAKVTDVRVDNGHNGVLLHGATESTLADVSLRDMAGDYGVRIMGDTDNRSYRTTVSNLRADNPTNGNKEITWLALDSYAYSLVIDKTALLQGGTGFAMQDTANTGDSYPVWTFAYDLELDHNHKNSALLAGGEGFYATVSWFGSNFDGACVHFAPTFRGEASITTSRVMGCANQGVLIEAPDVILSANHIGDNSNSAPQQYYDVELVGAGTNAILDANHIGDLVGAGGYNSAGGIKQQQDL